MDISINTIHRMLLDAALPSTLEDLKNPTEDYIMSLLLTFLSRFCIDINFINQPIAEQHNVMMYYEDSFDIINLMNLLAIVTQISDKIFIHDFCLTDITSPGQKRLRRQAKFLSNFVLYTMHKQSDFNDRMDQIQTTYKLLEELKEKKTQVLESINNKALYKAKQLSLIKELESDVQQTQSNKEENDKKESELEVKHNIAEKDHQKAKETCGSIKIAVGKLFKMIAELQSEVVHSPEEYQSRLKKLEEQQNLKSKDRNTMQEAIQDKKQSIKQIEEQLNFIPSMNGIPILKDIYKELKDKKTKSNNMKQQIDSLNNMFNEEQIKLTRHKDQEDVEMDKLQSHLEEDITPLHNLYSQLLSEEKIQKSKSKTNEAFLNEKFLKRNKLQADIQKKEEDTIAFLHSCQEAYDSEIAIELELRTILKEELVK